MHEKGIFLIMELLIGILLLIPLQNSLSPPNNSLAEENASILCQDLLTLWSYNEKDLEYFAFETFPEIQITFSLIPFENGNKNFVSCKGIRVEEGEINEIFIGVQW